jgi:predicted RNase H-like HicB family nuclease
MKLRGTSGGVLHEITDENGNKMIIAHLQGILYKEDDVWISNCISLDVATCGDTREEAMKNTVEAVNMWFSFCLEEGTLSEALTELGWKQSKKIQIEIQKKDSENEQTISPVFNFDSVEDKDWSGRVVFQNAA